jgi:hypothetical protein
MVYLDWITGFITLVGVYFTGKKRWFGQAIQFISQIFWAGLIVQRRLWGLIPLELTLFYLYARNAWRWYRDEINGRSVRLSSL